MISKMHLLYFIVIIHTITVTGSSFFEKCIDELGCFDYGSPFYDFFQRPYSFPPTDRDEINTFFLLYTPANPDTPQMFSNINKETGDISTSSFNPKVTTKFVVGGFMSGAASEWKEDMVDALIKYTKSNVFLVDWDGGDGPVYPVAVANTRVVGAEIALFIERLQNTTGLKTKDVHIIGHSLGSHIAGYAGKRLKNLGRITGMDPAGPYFTSVEPIVRLARNDALFVDVIHTNMAPLRVLGFGLEESIGHFDYFPNGGRQQPGCNYTAEALLGLFRSPNLDSIDNGVEDVSCNHVRAIELFISSIENTSCKLWGAACDSWDDYVNGKCSTCKGVQDGFCIPLGIDAEQYASKIKKDQSINLFLHTSESEPFCL